MTMMGPNAPTVKREHHDDHEINEMARKIAETNRAKVQQSMQGMAVAAAAAAANGHYQMARPGQPSIQNFMGRRGGVAGGPLATAPPPPPEENKVDGESRRGRFGWSEFEKNYIPFVYRYKNEKYTSVRMVERRFLSRFLSVLPPEVNSCHCIRSYYITEHESKLLNEINLKHTDCYFGKEAFTTKDLVVRLSDAEEFYQFLDLCFKKLVLKKSNASDRCGFFRINGESVVPYTVRRGVKYVPLFYFEGETEHLKLKADQVEGWDLAYLKFCCKVQGIRNELFAAEVCRVVALEEIKGHFPHGTTFEDYWPAKGSIEPVNSQRVHAGNWTQKPPSATGSSNKAASASSSAAVVNASLPHQNSYGHPALDSYGGANNPYMRASAAAAAANTMGSMAGLFSAAQATSNPHLHAHAASAKTFPGKLTQIKEFPVERSHLPPYKLQKALIDQKIVPCINVRPYLFRDLMMTLPDFVKCFCSDLSIEKARNMLQDILKIVLYKGNRSHQEILQMENKCFQYDPVPLVLVKDILNYMPQIKYMLSNLAPSQPPSSKRLKV
ncbi:hypothetical protein TCAL_04360 [Tigriopus californicus]|uniref:Uncharacterized protein n=1 Tax=Tigriopus californicus TaxID=6832 RepID=A0A553NQ38_TIGCA|nr:uncharacterized protein LOC131879846 [Tigriopus californicus]TRY67524.1 hypothetical protein TCAL_04360 [Tigriopus californicus]|eukprot:TCALIF_04360-PA protein Name:"Protein of unknown function" AED:0.00 eAED:0.00 QI:421/1/1/1/1/1/2/307/553